MLIHPISFVIGLGAAWALPIVARAFRPVAVQAAAVGMGLFEEAQRVVAEQLETLEDIAAEARVRREEMLREAEEADDVAPAENGAEVPTRSERRRRASRRGRAERSA